MPMGLINDDDFLKEYSNCISEKKEVKEDAIEGEVVDLPTAGRDEGDVNVPESLRKLIGETYAINGRYEGVELAKLMGLSESSASAYANGATSTKSYNEPKSDLNNYIKNRKNRITKKAMGKLISAIDEITPEKLANVKARDLASIAKDMSAVIKHMEPDQNNINNNSGVQFILYAPEMKNESEYDVIHVNE